MGEIIAGKNGSRAQITTSVHPPTPMTWLCTHYRRALLSPTAYGVMSTEELMLLNCGVGEDS